MASSKIRGITIELSADATGVLDAVKDINNSIKTTASQLKDVDRLLKLDPSNTQLLEQKTGLLQKQIQNTKDKLEELKKAQADMDANGVDKNSEQYQALQREIIATEQELKTLEKTAGSSSAALAKVSVVTGEIGDKMESAGKKLSVVSAGIVALGTAAVKSFKEVDEGADIVIKKTGATGEAAEEMEQIYKDLAGSVMGDFDEIGNAVGEVATRFQVSGDELSDMAEIFQKFAYINDTDVKSSIDNVQKAMSAFGLSTSDAETLLNVMNRAGQNTGVSMDTLASNLVTNATALQEMGLDAYQAAVFMAELETSGADSSAVLTGLKKALYNATQEGKSLDEALADLESQVLAAGDSQEALNYVYELFGSKAGPAIYQAIKNGTLSFTELADSVGITEDAMDSINNTYSATLDGTDAMTLAWKNMQLMLAELGEAIGSTLAPIMEKITGVIQNITKWFSSLDDNTKELIVTIGLIVAAVGPLLVVGGKVMKGISSITSALSSMGTLSLGPIGIAIAAIAGLTAAGVALFDSWKNAYQDASPFTEALEEIVKKNDELSESIASTKKSYDDTIESSEANASAAEYLTGKLNELMSSYDGTAGSAALIEGVVEQLNEIVPGLGLSWDSVTDSLNLTNEEIYANIEAMKAQAQVAALQDLYTESLKEQHQAQKNQNKAITTLMGVLDRYGASVSEVNALLEDGNLTMSEAWGFVRDHGIAIQDVTGFTEELTTAYGEAIDAIHNKEAADENVTFAENELGVAMANAAASAQTSAETVVQAADTINQGVDFTQAEETAAEAGQNIPEEMANGITENTAAVADATANVAETVTDGLSGLPGDTNKAGAEAGSGLDEGFDSYSDIVANTVDDMYEIFYSTLGVDLPPLMYKWGDKAGSRFDTGISGQESNIIATIKEIDSKIASAMNSLPAMMRSIGYQTGAGLYSELAAWESPLYSLMWSISNTIQAAARSALKISSPSKVMAQIGEFTGEGLELGLKNSEPGILAASTRISRDMAAALTPELSGVGALNAGINAGNVQVQTATANNMAGMNTVLQLLNQYLPEMAADKEIQFDDGTWAGRLAPAINQKFARMATLTARGVTS